MGSLLRSFALTGVAVVVLAVPLGAAVWYAPLLVGEEPGWEPTVQRLTLRDGRVFEGLTDVQASEIVRRYPGQIASGEMHAVEGAAAPTTFWLGLSFHLSMVVVSVVALRRRGERLGALKPGDAAFAAGLGTAAGALAVGYAAAVTRWSGFDPNPGTGPGTVVAMVPLLVLASITAPLGEELLFRGQLLAAALRSLSPRAALWLTSLLFAASHLRNDVGSWVAMPALLVVGLLLGRLRLRTGSVWPPVLAHAAYNATVIGRSSLG